MHSESLMGEAFRSLQLEMPLRAVQLSGAGCVIYMRGQEGRGIGLGNKIAAYSLQIHRLTHSRPIGHSALHPIPVATMPLRKSSATSVYVAEALAGNGRVLRLRWRTIVASEDKYSNCSKEISTSHGTSSIIELT